MMDVTFVLEESGVTATVEVPCEAKVAAAKEVACTALAVSPASVEMRIGTQVLEGTCRLQDTAFGAGVQVVLARRFANIKCPAEYTDKVPTGQRELEMNIHYSSLSPCGALCLFVLNTASFDLSTRFCYITGRDTETFSPAFMFEVDFEVCSAPAISRCQTRCYLMSRHCLLEVALPGGEVLRKVDGTSYAVFARGGAVFSRGGGGVSVYDEDLTLLRSLSHEGCMSSWAVSDCGGWVITYARSGKARLWDVNTGEAVTRIHARSFGVALSRSASVFAVVHSDKVQLYDWSGAALGSFEKESGNYGDYFSLLQFTPCGKYLVVQLMDMVAKKFLLRQYDVVTMSCVRVIPDSDNCSEFTISPCSRVVLFTNTQRDTIVTRHLYPY